MKTALNSPLTRTAPFFARKQWGSSPRELFFTKLRSVEVKKVYILNAMFLLIFRCARLATADDRWTA